MARNNNSFISNATLAIVNNTAEKVAKKFGGKVTRNDTVKGGNVLTDEELNKFHDALYIARIEFSEERHNAVEVTATATQFYITFGDTVAEEVAIFIRKGAEKEERKSKWNLKNKCYYNIDAWGQMFTEKTATVKSAEKKATATKAKKSATAKAKKTA